MQFKTALLILSLLSASIIYGQSFEGQIIYANQFTSKISNFSNEQLGQMIGTRQEYAIKGGNYKTVLNGQSISMQQYDQKNNRLYNKTAKSDTLYYFDASNNNDAVQSFEIKENAGKVLGNDCNAIVMKTRAGTTTMYYSAKYQADSSLFANHHYGNWSFYLSKSGALPLKVVMETPHFTMESEAVEIKAMKIDDSFFKLDPNAPVKQM